MKATRVTDRRRPDQYVTCRPRQKGIALMVLLTLLTMWGLSLFIGQFSAAQLRMVAVQRSATALSEAKQALVGDAISRSAIDEAGYLRLPDLGTGVGAVAEGQEAGNFAGNSIDMSVIGRIPWKSIASVPHRNEDSECLWYVVSGRFKKTQKTATLNWDTQGQIDLIDSSGATMATNLAALIVAPGRVLEGQDRSLADPAYVECGGNYDARNYLDAYDASNAINGEVNYFSGTNNRVSSDTNNKRFVVADNDHYNDRFIAITTDDLFRPLAHRSDFKYAVRDLLNNVAAQSLAVSGTKGTDNLSCVVGDDFCTNWREMLFLTKLPAPSSVTIDGIPSPTSCSHVLLFSGSKISGQSRSTTAEKSDRNNYLEGANATSFNIPTASAALFSGAYTFDWRSPGADLIRCLP